MPGLTLGVAVDSSDNVYVTAGYVLKYYANGTLITSFGQSDLSSPYGQRSQRPVLLCLLPWCCQTIRHCLPSPMQGSPLTAAAKCTLLTGTWRQRLPAWCMLRLHEGSPVAAAAAWGLMTDACACCCTLCWRWHYRTGCAPPPLAWPAGTTTASLYTLMCLLHLRHQGGAVGCRGWQAVLLLSSCKLAGQHTI